MSQRTDYKIGTYHGTLNPTISSPEAKLRNAIYLIGSLLINITNTITITIRIIGYEIPLVNRVERIDLMGYDEDFNFWLIELKDSSNTMKIPDVIKQIDGYENIINTNSLLKEFEKEIKDKFFWKCFRFSGKIKKLIIAPREYFNSSSTKTYKGTNDLFLCSLAKIQDHKDLLEKLDQFDRIHLSVKNK